MDDRDKFYNVNKQILAWYIQERELPGYEPGNGHPFLAHLLGAEYSKILGATELVRLIDNVSPGLHGKLLGPHGWTVMQALIIRYQERIKNGTEPFLQGASGHETVGEGRKESS